MKIIRSLRIYALILSVCALLCIITACGETDTPEVSTEQITAESIASTDAPETEPSVQELVIFSGSDTEYIIVRPEDAENTKPYTDFRNDLREVTASKINIDIDAFYRGHEYDENKAEILCGFVDYPEIEGAADGLAFDEYRIIVKGKKIVIVGRSDETLSAGLDAFCSYVGENIKDGSLIIKSDLDIKGNVAVRGFSLLTESIPVVDGYTSAVLSHCGDGYQQATLSEASSESYTDYCATLAADGFTLYAENKMAENSFATYTKGEISVHTYFTPHNSEMRIIVSKDKVLPWIDSTDYTKICEPTLTLMGLEKSGSGGGLGMIIGLEDGSFIIVDGGNNNKTEADDLANTLKSLAPDKNNVLIRAWIFTHGHGDHTGAFIKFSELYGRSGNFKVEKFLYNFCDAESQRVHGGISYTKTLNAIKSYWKDAVSYKTLTGQVYSFPGCKLEILYCMSDFIPQVIGEEKGISDIDLESIDGNIETMVSRAYVGGQTLMITGDTSKVCVDEICDRYGSYLKSDILQVPHHGHNSNRYRARNGTAEFYRFVDPSIVLWPSDEAGFVSRTNWNGVSGSNFEANYILVNKLNVKEVIVAGKTTRTLTLPYTAN